MKTSLMRMLGSATKNVRMWPTWKLKVKEVDMYSKEICLWDTMSERDQNFNLVWNQICGDCKDLSLPKLQKVMDFVRVL